MKTTSFLLAAICMLSTSALHSGEDRLVRFVAEIRPIGVLSSAHADALRVSSATKSETSDSNQSVVASALIGIAFDTPILDVELKCGIGGLTNPSFYGGFYQFDIAVLGETDRFRFGPHIGILTYDSLHWTGNADLQLDNNAGWLGGLLLEYRTGSFSWSLGLDYYDCEIDLKPGLGWTTNHDQLELSGTMVQLGLKKRF